MFDPILMSKITGLLEGGGIGRSEKVILVNDGNTEGKETFITPSPYYAYVRVGNIIDPATVSQVTMVYDGVAYDYSARDLTIAKQDECHTIISSSDVTGVWILGEGNEWGVSAGTYALTFGRFYISRIITETIHPIDPKYLSKTVLDLNDLGLDWNTFFSGTAIPVNDAIIQSIKNTAELQETIYIRYTHATGDVQLVKMDCAMITANDISFIGFDNDFIAVKLTVYLNELYVVAKHV